MNCPDCKTIELMAREGWIDIDMEYRHIEYLWCCRCDGIFAHSGLSATMYDDLTVDDEN
jgi:hypothetical protein